MEPIWLFMGDTPEAGRLTGSGKRQLDGGSVASATDRTPAVVVEGLSKQFGTGDEAIVAVDDVSFSIDRGAIVGVLGPNGAGKTTLIKCILEIVMPDGGSIRVLGNNVTAGCRAVYADVDAMLEGARNDYWRLTVRENLRYFATVSGIDPDSVTARHNRLLDRLDLTEKADTPVRDLSRGMKQKVSLASVLAGGAELVFLDEPTLGLDVESSRTLRRELRRLVSEEGLTIVLSSHDMGVIEDVCDRVIVMSDGRIIADDTVPALVERADWNRIQLNATGVEETVLEALQKNFDVYDVTTAGDRTRIELSAGGTELYPLMETLQAGGVVIKEISTVEPDLEDVFVSLTGSDERAIRTDGDLP